MVGLWHGVSDMTLSAEAVAVQQLSQPPPRPFTKHWLKDFTIYPFKNQEAYTRNLLQSMSLRISLCMSCFKSGLNAMISVDILANTQLWFLSYDFRCSVCSLKLGYGIWHMDLWDSMVYHHVSRGSSHHNVICLKKKKYISKKNILYCDCLGWSNLPIVFFLHLSTGMRSHWTTCLHRDSRATESNALGDCSPTRRKA